MLVLRKKEMEASAIYRSESSGRKMNGEKKEWL